MVISHKHQYVFVELPRTGTTAISRELCQLYDGERILRKHATYNDFLKIASPEETRYFVFTCIRNPLDDAVSHYFKLKTNHGDRYTRAIKPGARKRLAERLDLILFKYINKKDAGFADFFKKAYILPYNNWVSMNRDQYNYVMRFENLPEDFARVIQLIGLELKRPLPPRNVTSSRDRNFASYYTEDLIPRARRVFGPFMKEWGYEFPKEWGNGPIPWWNHLEFKVVNQVRKIYWNYLRTYM